MSVITCLKAIKLMQNKQKRQTSKQKTNKKTQDNNKNHPEKLLH